MAKNDAGKLEWESVVWDESRAPQPPLLAEPLSPRKFVARFFFGYTSEELVSGKFSDRFLFAWRVCLTA